MGKYFEDSDLQELKSAVEEIAEQFWDADYDLCLKSCWAKEMKHQEKRAEDVRKSTKIAEQFLGKFEDLEK